METTTRTWLITGASRGFGRLWARAVLQRGERVAATARDAGSLADLADGLDGVDVDDQLLVLDLDVTDRARAVAVVARVVERFGRLDVVVNNAGYGHFGMVEELTEAELRAQLETNFFGAVWVTQAALPVMRAQGSGHLLQVTSEGGVRSYPGIGAYHASKWALTGLDESLAQEVARFGIKVTNIEPGPYATGWLDVGSRSSAPLAAYDAVRAGGDGFEVGDPAATVDALFAVVDAEAPPLHVFFGRSYEAVREQYLARLAQWEAWQPVALAAFG